MISKGYIYETIFFPIKGTVYWDCNIATDVQYKVTKLANKQTLSQDNVSEERAYSKCLINVLKHLNRPLQSTTSSFFLMYQIMFFFFKSNYEREIYTFGNVFI